MCSANDLTYGGGAIDGYTLSDNDAAALRRPMIRYPNGRVPVEVVSACVDGKIDPQIVKVENGTVDLSEVLGYLKTAGQIGQVTEAVADQAQRQFSLTK